MRALQFISILALTCGLLLGATQPLTEQQQARLDTARDGHDHRDEAFMALLENVRTWTSALADEPVRLQFSPDAMIAEPDAFRGDLVAVEGRLEQRSHLQRVYEDVEEWFVRLDDQTPIIVFVVNASDHAGIQHGRTVSLIARFYKRIDAIDRMGIERSYAAFVAAHPREVLSHTQGTMLRLWVVAAPVAALLVAFGLLMVFIRRNRRSMTKPHVSVYPDAELDDSVDLPDDPAEALAELQRRARM